MEPDPIHSCWRVRWFTASANQGLAELRDMNPGAPSSLATRGHLEGDLEAANIERACRGGQR